MSAPKRIFITGISSSILSGLCKSLQEENHELIGLSRNKFVRKGIQIIQGDLQDPSSWNKEVQHCDLIIHAAAITHTHDESKYYSVNYEASKKLIDACPKSAGFVFISSRTAGEKSGAYGHSKWMAEEYLKENHARYIILSPSEVYGSVKKEGIESLVHDAQHKKIIPYPAGVKSPLSPIHVDDLTRLMKNWILDKDWPKESVILNGPEYFLYPDLIKAIAKASGNNPFLIPIPRFAMNILAKVSALMPGKLPFTSDQVARLYAPKKTVRMDDKSMLTIHDYVKLLIA
jgi:nucleoside-diphosphate-sugar epimerase